MKADNKLIGVTRYCIYPSRAQNKIIVGGTKSPKLDLIKSLQPDLILANKEENTKEKIEELQKIATVFVTYPMNIQEAVNLIEDLGRLLECKIEIVKKLTSEITKPLNKIKSERLIRTKVKVFCPIWKDPWMSINRDTFIHNLLETINFENVTGQYEQRYPQIEIAKLGEIHVILLPNEPYEFKKEDEIALQRMSKFQNTSIELIDGSYLSWHGSRLKVSLPYLLNLMKFHTKVLV